MANTTSLLALAGAVGLGLWATSKNERERKKPKTPATTTPKPPALPSTPFVEGTSCTQTLPNEEMTVWMDKTVKPVFEDELKDFPTLATTPPVGVPDATHAQMMRLLLTDLIDEIGDRVMGPCPDKNTDAYALAWKAVWCGVALELSQQGRIAEEPDAITKLCEDADFDPHRNRPAPVIAPIPPVEPAPTIPTPLPFPVAEPIPPAPPGPPEGVSLAPNNIRLATTRQEIRQSGVMRAIEATPQRLHKLTAYKTVLLAYDPEWSDFPRARADLMAYAQAHPDITFYLVSFHDTQREFGKPAMLGTLRYVLTAIGPSPGYAYQWPVVGQGLQVSAPTHATWSRVIDYASHGPELSIAQVVTNPSPHPRSAGAQLLGLRPHTTRPRKAKRSMRPQRRSRRHHRLSDVVARLKLGSHRTHPTARTQPVTRGVFG